MRPREEDFYLLNLDSRTAAELEDSADMPPRVRRNVRRHRDQRDAYFRQHLDEQVNASAERLHEVHDELDDQLDDLKQQARRVKVGLTKGRVTAAEGRKQLAEIGREARVIRERADQLKSDDAALAALAAMTPADYEAYMVGTYPALRGCGPTLTVADLNQP